MTSKELETLARLLRPPKVYTTGYPTDPLVRAVTYTSLPAPPPSQPAEKDGFEVEEDGYPPGFPNQCPANFKDGTQTWTAPGGKVKWKFFARESKWRVVWEAGDPKRSNP